MRNLLLVFFILISLKTFSQDDQLKTDWANLKKYSADNKQLGLVSKTEKRIVFMGNSITEFWKYTDSIFFAGQSYINRGISGQTTPQMLVRFRPDVIALKPLLVVILAGINDIAQNTGPISLEDIFGNIVSMIQLAEVNKIKVVVSSVLPAYDFPWRPGLKPAEKIVSLNLMLSTYCKANHIVYADYYSKMVNEQKGLDQRYSNDGVHPTLAGYKIMEPIIEEAINKALK